MCLVDDDPVRQAGEPTDLVEHRQRGVKVGDLLGVRTPRQVDNQAAIRITQRADQLLRRGQRCVEPDDVDSRQRFQGTVVTLRIEHAHRVTLEDQLFAQQTGDPGLPRLGVTRDEDVTATDGQRELAAVALVSQAQAAPDAGRLGQAPRRGQATDATPTARARSREQSHPPRPGAPHCPTRPPRRLRRAAVARGRFPGRQSPTRLCAESRSVSRSTRRPVALLTPCATAITRPPLKSRTSVSRARE